MSLMRVQRFAHFLGIQDEKTSVPILKKQPTLKQVKVEKVMENKALKSPTKLHRIDFSHLLAKGSANYEGSRVYEEANPAAYQEAPPKQMTSAEAANYIIEAGNKARGAGHPRQAFERVSEMLNRAKKDHVSGIAALIINSGGKARGENN
jgi:hypothetical protein